MAGPNELLAQLSQHPAWPLLHERMDEYKQKHANHVAAQFLRRNHQPDYAELQWQRGVFHGISLVLAAPALEWDKVQKALTSDREEVI